MARNKNKRSTSTLRARPRETESTTNTLYSKIHYTSTPPGSARSTFTKDLAISVHPLASALRNTRGPRYFGGWWVALVWAAAWRLET